jgi:TPR repeat protein
LLKAAEEGQAPAMTDVGVMLYDGEGVTMDRPLALPWLHKAAALGSAEAMHNIAVMLEHGVG